MRKFTKSLPYLTAAAMLCTSLPAFAAKHQEAEEVSTETDTEEVEEYTEEETEDIAEDTLETIAEETQEEQTYQVTIFDTTLTLPIPAYLQPVDSHTARVFISLTSESMPYPFITISFREYEEKETEENQKDSEEEHERNSDDKQEASEKGKEEKQDYYQDIFQEMKEEREEEADSLKVIERPFAIRLGGERWYEAQMRYTTDETIMETILLRQDGDRVYVLSIKGTNDESISFLEEKMYEMAGKMNLKNGAADEWGLWWHTGNQDWMSEGIDGIWKYEYEPFDPSDSDYPFSFPDPVEFSFPEEMEFENEEWEIPRLHVPEMPELPKLPRLGGEMSGEESEED